MKQPATDVFDLIKALSQNEKTYFKKQAKLHVLGDGNLYVLLFDEIVKQTIYNEEQLLKKLNCGKRMFAVTKNYLYSQILYSLANYKSSLNAQVRYLLSNVEILFDKSLIPQCIKQIEKAKKICRQFELFEEMLEVLRWDYRLAVKKFDMTHRMKVLKEENNILKLLNNQKIYRDLANNFSLKYQQYGAERSSKDLVEMKKLLHNSFLKDENKALCLRAKQNFYDCHYLFSQIKGDFKKSYHFSKKMTDMYHENPGMISLNTTSYLTAINNFLVASNGLLRYDEMRQYISKLEATRMNLKSSSDKATAFFYLYNLLNYFISTGKFNEAEQDVKRIEKEMVEHETNLNQLQKIILYATISQIYFGQENYKRCLSCLNKIISFGEMKARTDIEGFIRIFQFIVRYEMKSDMYLMNSLFKSTYRFLDKQQRLYKFELVMMEFIRNNMIKKIRRNNIKKEFFLLKEKLILLSKNKYEQHAFEYFDYISWLESKIENKSFAEVVRGKAK